MDEETNRLGTREAGAFLANMQKLQSSSGQFGERSDISAPNLASIMVIAEEDGKSILLTGDGSSDDVKKGLSEVGKLDDEGRCHVDILKIPHHGAAANINEDFLQNVIADHYVFCGNGSHTNPEIGVVDLVANSRFGPNSVRSQHADTANGFHLHFNTTPELAGTQNRTKHMKSLEGRVTDLIGESVGQMNGTFHSDSFFDILL